MLFDARPPAGPRGAIGAAAEEAAAAYLQRMGWTVLARNLQFGQDEVDIVAQEPGDVLMTVVVEVRSRTGVRFGTALESVDGRKVARLYRAAMTLRRRGHPAVPRALTATSDWRVDLLALQRTGRGWVVETHLRGLSPPRG